MASPASTMVRDMNGKSSKIKPPQMVPAQRTTTSSQCLAPLRSCVGTGRAFPANHKRLQPEMARGDDLICAQVGRCSLLPSVASVTPTCRSQLSFAPSRPRSTALWLPVCIHRARAHVFAQVLASLDSCRISKPGTLPLLQPSQFPPKPSGYYISICDKEQTLSVPQFFALPSILFAVCSSSGGVASP